MEDTFMKDANIKMLEDMLKILETGYYWKDRRKINLRLSLQEMEHVQILLPEDAESISDRAEIAEKSRVFRGNKEEM